MWSFASLVALFTFREEKDISCFQLTKIWGFFFCLCLKTNEKQRIRLHSAPVPRPNEDKQECTCMWPARTRVRSTIRFWNFSRTNFKSSQRLNDKKERRILFKVFLQLGLGGLKGSRHQHVCFVKPDAGTRSVTWRESKPSGISSGPEARDTVQTSDQSVEATRLV